jgi:hypothetical protein
VSENRNLRERERGNSLESDVTYVQGVREYDDSRKSFVGSR